jgi:hypothetical protein
MAHKMTGEFVGRVGDDRADVKVRRLLFHQKVDARGILVRRFIVDEIGGIDAVTGLP